MFSSQQTGQLIGIGILTQTYICEHSHFIAYMKVSKEKLFMLIMIQFLLLLSSLECKYRRRPAMTAGQLTANNRRRLFCVYSWPAAGDMYAHTTPNFVKLLPIYERDIGQAAASPISRPSSPLSAMNAYKSSAPRL